MPGRERKPVRSRLKSTIAVRQAWKWGAFLLLSTTFLVAAEPKRLEKTIETIQRPRVSIANLSGQVVVKGWEKNQVHVMCNLPSNRVEVDTEVLPAAGQAEKIHFTTHVLDPLATGAEEMADYTLEVPAGANVEIRNPQGSVRLEGLHSDTSVESVGGRIVATDVSGHLALQTMGGDIEAIRPSGRVEAYSITGNLHFVSPATAKLRGSTTSGRIVYEGDFVSGGDYTLSAYSGDMDIVCPASSSFELNAKTVHGKVDNRLPLTSRRHAPSPLSPGNSLLGTRNTGNATVELRSFSGTIHIRPQL